MSHDLPTENWFGFRFMVLSVYVACPERAYIIKKPEVQISLLRMDVQPTNNC